MTAPQQQRDSILDSGPGGPPCVSFASPPYIYGTPQGGVILQPYKVQQTRNQKTNEPMFWPKSNEPMQTLVFVVQTDQRTGPEDDGIRRLFVDKASTNVPDSQWSTFADAIEKAQAPGPRPGGVLLFAVLGKRQGDRNQRNVWACQYTAPSPEAEAYYTEQAAKQAAGPPDSVMSTPLANGAQPQQQPNYVQQPAGPAPSPFGGNGVPAAPAQWGQPVPQQPQGQPQPAYAGNGGQPAAPAQWGPPQGQPQQPMQQPPWQGQPQQPAQPPAASPYQQPQSQQPQHPYTQPPAADPSSPFGQQPPVASPFPAG